MSVLRPGRIPGGGFRWHGRGRKSVGPGDLISNDQLGLELELGRSITQTRQRPELLRLFIYAAELQL